jgi:hypothetical protein
MPLFPVKGARVLALHCLALPIVFALTASPLLVLNTIQFHSPLKTGYDYYLSPALAKFAVFPGATFQTMLRCLVELALDRSSLP